jgi:hypothetical protein
LIRENQTCSSLLVSRAKHRLDPIFLIISQFKL